MKPLFLPLATCIIIFGPCVASAGLIITQSVGLEIPDYDPSGLVSVINFNTGGKYVSSLEVNLQTTGGWNGDLYAYLQHTSGSTSVISVLLNRPGRTAENEAGAASSGLDVVFKDGAEFDLNTAISGTYGDFVSGDYQPDARSADPDLVTGSSPRSLYLSGFNGMLADGDWTLFMADLAGGDTATLSGWSISMVTSDSPITGVPEPSGFLLGAVPALIGGFMCMRRRVVRKCVDT